MSKKESTGKATKATLAVTMIIIISKLAGLVREAIVAAYYGTGMEMDAYSSAYSLYYIPILLFNSCITSTMIPLYSESMSDRGIDRANEFASNVVNLFALFALALSAVMFLAADPLAALFYHGFSAEKHALTVHLTRIMMPSLMFIVISIVVASILNAREKYMAAQLTGFPLTIAVVAATVLFSEKYGIQAIAWGVGAAAVLQIIILMPFTRNTFRYSMRLSLKDERFRRLVVLAVPAMLSMAVNELNHMVDKMLAAPLPDGNMAVIDYASRLLTFVTGILVVPLVTVTFSRMSKTAAAHDTPGVGKICMDCTETMSMFILPIMAILIVLSPDVIRAAYMRGNFDEASVALTAPVFAFYMVGVLGFGLRDLVTRAFNAIKDTRTPMIVAIVSVVLNIILDVAMVQSMGINGLALATSIAATTGALTLFILLKRRIGAIPVRRMLIEIGKMAIAAVFSAAACVFLKNAMPTAQTWWQSVIHLGICALCAGAVYIGATLIAGVKQMRAIMTALGKLIAKRLHKGV